MTVKKKSITSPTSPVNVRKSNKLKPIHMLRESLFSNASGFKDYTGFKNLTVLLLVLTNLNVFLQNILKYGNLVNPIVVISFLEKTFDWPSTLLFMSSFVFIHISFLTELSMAKFSLSEFFVSIVQSFICLCLLLVPVYVGFITDPHPLWYIMTLSWYTVLFLKIYSYSSVNKWCREEKGMKKEDKTENKPEGPVLYPNNLSTKDMYYFILAPTLCYELNFPRTEKINLYFLSKRSIEFVFFLFIMIASFQQWIVKTVHNSVKPIDEMNYPRIFERLLTLAIPNHLLWLMGFYMFFHCFLNIIAELLRFGDREFYRAWWNASKLSHFWGDWNVPIHNWCKRHVYLPLVRHNYSKWTSMVIVFFISAFFHEYIVAVPLKMMKPWAFAGMLAQVPIAVITNYMEFPWGNVVMWISLIMGQPLAILMYYHDWYVRETLNLNATLSH